jgi:hypothetical protein
MRLSKREWYYKGGFRNARLYRKADRLGRWRYYEDS